MPRLDATMAQDRGVQADAAHPADAAAIPTDGSPHRPDASPSPVDGGPPALTARDYCAHTVEMFCDFYLRCGRLSAADADDCRARFMESCGARYGPYYIAYEDQRRLRYDPAARDTCAAHLATVACEQQVFDLSGPCGQMWRGLGGPGEPCGPGIESFVCAPGTTCVVGLDLCGACQPIAADGAACAPDGPRCHADSRCHDGLCVPRARPGEPCGEVGCILGAICRDGHCAYTPPAADGEPCARDGACRYAARCVDSRCVRGVLEGAPCAPGTPCIQGTCRDGRCVNPLPPDAPCTDPAACLTAACTEGRCAPIPRACRN